MMRRGVSWWERAAFVLSIAFFIGLYLEMFAEARNYFYTGSYGALLSDRWEAGAVGRVLGYTACTAVLQAVLWKWLDQILRFVERRRYVIAAMVLVLCVVLKLNGSSIVMWARYLGRSNTPEGDRALGVLFGFPRGIRSDEWATFTPICISQTVTGFGAVSNALRGIATDVTTTYGAPAFAPVTLFRPFLWGYMLFGAERGLSFYWCARLICLFLASYECARVYTESRKYLSAVAAVIITFSATVQWWFSTNGFVEMLIFGQVLIVLIQLYMKQSSYIRKLLCAFGMAECVGGVVFTYYPAQEIPWIFVIAVLGITFIIRNRKNFDFSPKRECAALLPAIFLLAAVSGAAIWTSRDTIAAIMNTAYPGKRISLGGGCDLTSLMSFVQSIFLPVDADRIALNACESASIFSFFPFGTVLAAICVRRRRDLICAALTVLQTFFVVFVLFGIPEWAARVTMMSNVTSGRLLPIIAILELILFLRSYALLFMEREKYSDRHDSAWCVLTAALIAVVYMCVAYTAQTDYMRSAYRIAALICVFWIAYGFLNRDRKAGKQIVLLTVVATIGLSGATVNPLQQGTDVITQDPLLQTIKELAEQESDAVWAVTELEYPVSNLPIIAGVPTVGSINVYPAMELWKKLDPEGVYEEIYNRYAHFLIKLTEWDTSFELLFADSVQISLSYADLDVLGVRYIISSTDYRDRPEIAARLRTIGQADGLYILEVVEDSGEAPERFAVAAENVKIYREIELPEAWSAYTCDVHTGRTGEELIRTEGLCTAAKWPSNNRNTHWTIELDTSGTDPAGDYMIEASAVDPDGVHRLLSSDTLSMDQTTRKLRRLIYTQQEYDSVSVAVWSAEDQSDIVWYTAYGTGAASDDAAEGRTGWLIMMELPSGELPIVCNIHTYGFDAEGAHLLMADNLQLSPQ